MYQFAGLVRVAGRAIFAQHQNLGVRDRLANRVWPPVHFFRRQVGGTEGFGQAIHQERFGPGRALAQQSQRFTRHAATGIGKVAQLVVDRRRPFKLRQLDIQGRNRSESGDFFALHRLEHVARHQVVEQNHPRANMKRGSELAESGIERQRQGREQGIA